MTTQAPRTPRKTAAERREDILESALTEFADHGFEGASTDAIARRVGISQPYLFRLFHTKKELFIATIERCMSDELERFRQASDGLTGHEALAAMGRAYVDMITTDPRRLRGQMQAYAACDDPAIAAVARAGFGRLVAHVEALGLTPVEVSGFFARGMLINVMASMGLPSADHVWSSRMLAGCTEPVQ
jgi:AcrR family transcriptional regulator